MERVHTRSGGRDRLCHASPEDSVAGVSRRRGPSLVFSLESGGGRERYQMRRGGGPRGVHVP